MALPDRFERYELKYRLPQAQYERLLTALTPHLQPDRYFRSTIASLYYDTPDHRLIRRSLEHPVYKEKLRLRSYGPAAESDPVFVELKKKYDHVVYKRRITMPLAAATAFLAGGPAADTQISREITYFRDFYPQLAPSMLLMYDREAYVAKSDPSLRITFDHRVRYRTTALALHDVESGTLLLPNECLLEVKTGAALPLWLLRIFEQEKLYRTSFSKYGTAFLQTASEGGQHP
ncbi:MAG: polyphosphate polymerase domain-containing protein [Clostridia bacterium]|nr:polyphosphate polymerase domain-containing protein [Clostridia bacterium]